MVCASDHKAFWTPHRRCVSVLMGGNPEHAGEIMSVGWFGNAPASLLELELLAGERNV